MYNYFIKDILKYLPHRHPFLLVDQILEYSSNFSLVAVSNMSKNDFLGHFPKKIIYPGFLLLELVAQSCGLLLSISNPKISKDIFYCLGSVISAKFKQMVIPEAQLIIKIFLKNFNFTAYKFYGSIFVKKKLVFTTTLILVQKKF
ncbi:3-hydroxyacyl-ACP dehydratase FabZ family protein [Buchnera aphidicola]|uniref:3-hydroxyacyl-ACP dehydratase FabZ family protein n=1 Tax=Buchnera aphidicola TaxID=9 RepID=UPI0031B6FE27